MSRAHFAIDGHIIHVEGTPEAIRALQSLHVERDTLVASLRVLVNDADSDHNSEADSLYVMVNRDHVEQSRALLAKVQS
jgi:hypothetical protein